MKKPRKESLPSHVFRYLGHRVEAEYVSAFGKVTHLKQVTYINPKYNYTEVKRV